MAQARSATRGTTGTVALERDLPPELADVAAAVEVSRSLLDLPDDWDGEGSPAYDQATWRRAVDFLLGNALGIWEEQRVEIPAPKIRKGPPGSIDLHWRTPTRELLINLPADPDEPADYYGDDGSGGHAVKGTFDPASDGYQLLLWLTT